MNLVIDIGNSRIKAGVFNDSKLINEFVLDKKGLKLKESLDALGDQIKNCIISAVAGIPPEIISLLKALSIPTILLGTDTNLPFRNNYKSKKSLGQDRVAGIAGACLLHPQKNVLVIDAGTAITFDLKSKNEEYLGGNISPGMVLRFRALHDYTTSLPLLTQQDTHAMLGNSTQDAIVSGVQNSLLFEIEGYIEELSKTYSDLIIILTGGDSPFFENRLKKPIFVVSNLTLLGLNFILEYNAEKY